MMSENKPLPISSDTTSSPPDVFICLGRCCGEAVIQTHSIRIFFILLQNINDHKNMTCHIYEVGRPCLHDNMIITGIMVLLRCSSQHVLVTIKLITSDGAHTVPVVSLEQSWPPPTAPSSSSCPPVA